MARNEKMKIHDMPKLESPFEREDTGEGKDLWIVVPRIKEQYRWVFTEEAEATDKLDGTNVSIERESGNIKRIFNRTNEISLFAKGSKPFIEGLYNAMERDYFLNLPENGQIFGELIGPKVQGNPYKLDQHLWIPFSYIREKYRFKFWETIVKELAGKTDEEIFIKVEKVFKGLWSIYKRARKVEGKPEDINENVSFEGLAAEGMVFYRKGTDGFIFNERYECINMCKLRRDMFSWFKGQRHE